MKNFKKVLALALAVVMLLSFATVAGAVTSDWYEDSDKIDYVEAVDVLGAIGVLEGYPDDTFRPDNTITRAESAKIIAMFDNGSSTINGLYAKANPFTDCDDAKWAESYIAYCAKMGIIAGMGGTRFAPQENVTGVQFLKMVLVVLGYDAKAEGLTGTNWDVNTLALAKRVGLTNSLTVKFDYSADLKRQEAAVIMLDALRAGTVEYGSKFVLGTLTWDDDKGFYYETKGSQPYMTVAGAVLTGDQLKDDWGLTESYYSDAFFRPYRTWALNGSTIKTYMITPAAEYETAYTECDLLVDLGYDKTDGTELAYKLAVNGNDPEAKTTKHTTVNHTATGDCKALDVTNGGQGVLTQVFYIDSAMAEALTKIDKDYDAYEWEEGYIVCEIHTWLGTVSNAKKTTVNSYGHLVSSTTANIELYTGTDIHDDTCLDGITDLTTTAEGLANDDYVLATYSYRDSAIIDVDVVTPVNGKLTGYKWQKLDSQTAVDGKYIPDSLHFHEDYDESKDPDNLGETFGFIYDAHGNVIGMVDEVGTSTKYLVVDKLALTQENVYDAVIRANVVGLDAKTTEKTSVASIKYNVGGTGYVEKDVEDFATSTANSVFFWSTLKDEIGDDLGVWKLDASGNYVIDLSEGYRFLEADGGPYAITKGIPEVNGAEDSNATVTGTYYATDASTIYLIHENDGSYTSVTGYKNIDTLKAKNVEIIDTNKDGVAEIVYVWGSVARAGDSFVAYIGDTEFVQWRELAGGEKYYKGTVYVNDVATDICIDKDDYDTLTASTDCFVKFSYTNVSADSESYAKIVEVGNKVSLNEEYEGISAYNNIFTALNSSNEQKSFGLADNVVVYRITIKGTVVKAADAEAYLAAALGDHNDAGDPVMHLGFDADGLVNVIYVHEDPVS